MNISIIVVIGKNREIGCNNRLLWELPVDMKRFKKITTGHTVVMGSKTFESIGKALPNRNNIVIAFDKDYKAPNCSVVTSIDEAVEMAKQQEKNGEVFIIGGGSIYEQFMPIANKLYLTIVDDEPVADIFFPDYSAFKNIVSEEGLETDDYKLTFLELTK